jgi:predicted permease
MARRAFARLRGLLGHVPVEREVDDEVGFHIEMQTRRYIDAGMPADAARVAAIRRFGDLATVRGEMRDIGLELETAQRRTEYWHELKHDLRYAFRLLRSTPLVTAVALFTIALGIGATTAIVSVVHAVLLRSLPYPNVDEVMVIWPRYGGATAGGNAVAPPEFADMRDQLRSFASVAAFTRRATNITGECGTSSCEPERAASYVVSANMLDLLGVRPALGRGFRYDEGDQSAERVVILSHGLWMRRYGGDASIIGQVLRIGGLQRTVIGVMPADVRFPEAPLGFLRDHADLWIPFNWERSRTEERGNQYLAMIGRVRPAVSLAQASADLEAVAARFRAEWPDRYAGKERVQITPVPLREQMLGDATRPLMVLLGAVVLVLLIACVNVANLLLARGATRRKELAIRAALGAGRGRIVRQLLTESVVLAAIGGVLGVALAAWGVRALVQLDPGSIPRLVDARLDGTVLLVSLGIAIATGVLFGLAPALQLSRSQVHEALQDMGRGSTESRGRGRLRRGLVVAEVAMALMVLVGAGLLVRSFSALMRTPTGVNGENVLSFQVSLPRASYDSASKVFAFHRELSTRLSALPGVERVGGVHPLPLGGEGWSGSFVVEGQPVPAGEPTPHAEFSVAMPGYFRTIGISIVEGREFSEQDGPGAPRVAIVDERLAKQMWPNQSPIGKRVDLTEDIWWTVVGVVGHVRRGGPTDDGEPQIYLPLLQRPEWTLSIVVRTTGDPAMLAGAVRGAVKSIDSALPVAKLQPMRTVMNAVVARPRFNLLVLAIFAVVALVLAAVGLYGVMAYAVAQRGHEIGIRLALGGRPADAMRMVVREGMALVVVGLTLGTMGALALSGAMNGLLFQIDARDPMTYGIIVAVLVTVALIACAVPARRATRIDPIEVMRG